MSFFFIPLTDFLFFFISGLCQRRKNQRTYMESFYREGKLKIEILLMVSGYVYNDFKEKEDELLNKRSIP